jgi:hypothetical protein
MPTTAPNLNCGPDVAGTTTAPLTISGTVTDYLTGAAASGAMGELFFDGVIDDSPDLTATADESGAYSYTVPAGTSTIVAGKTDVAGDNVEVHAYRGRFNESADNSDVSLYVLSRNSADQLYGLVGIPTDTTKGTATMLQSDCDGRNLENAIGTLSTTSSANGADPTFVAGSYVFYGADGDIPAPVRRNVRDSTADNGVVFVFGVPPGTYYAQAWGFTSAADVDMGRDGLTLIAEYQLLVVPDVVGGIFMRPSEGPL